MKLHIIILFAITFVKYSTSDETTLSPEEQHTYECNILIETVYQESCQILMRPNKMGHAMIGFRDGNDSKGIEFCSLVPEGANCVLDELPKKVPDDCKSLESYKKKIAIARHDDVYSDYFCANNMQHLRDRSQLDGMDCLYVREFYTCKNRINRASQRVVFTEKEELCREYYLSKECSVNFGPCENQKVKDIQLQLFDFMLQGMDCPESNIK